MRQVLRDLLVAANDVRFDHHAHQRAVALADLVDHVGHHQRLQFRLFIAVRVRAVDHQVGRQLGFGQRLFGDGDRDRIVVRAAVAAAQHHVAVRVAARAYDGDIAFGVDAQEGVRVRRRQDRVHRNADVAIGAVLEADWRRQAGRHFAVRLRFGGARADGRPGDQVAQVLRRDRVQRFGGGRHAQFAHVEQELARLFHAFVDLERIVHVRVVDIAFPARGGTRFFEIHAHHQQHRVLDFLLQRFQAARVIEAGDGVVDRAWADDDEQALVLAVDDVAQRFAAAADGVESTLRQRQFGVQFGRCRHGREGSDVDIFDVWRIHDSGSAFAIAFFKRQ